MYEQTTQGLPPTNNAVEGWLCSVQANVGGCHPNMELYRHPEARTKLGSSELRAFLCLYGNGNKNNEPLFRNKRLLFSK